MSLKRWWLSLFLTAALLAACQSNDVVPNGPRLISEVTIAPATRAPTRYLSPTPPTSTPATSTPTPTVTTTVEQTETVTPVMTFTAAVEFTAVTPTMPPSKTPTITPTVSDTPVPTLTPQPTQPIATIIPVLVPTQVFQPPEAVIAAIAANPTLAQPTGDLSVPLPGTPEQPRAACSSAQWFFTRPSLPDCPLNPAVVTNGAYEPFEFGFMVWVESQKAIYVFYDTEGVPKWDVFPDTWAEGMPEKDVMLDGQTHPYEVYQPRRGFGLIWRNNPDIRARIGWAKSSYEHPYEVKLQVRTDGTIYISDPYGLTFALTPDKTDWKMYH